MSTLIKKIEKILDHHESVLLLLFLVLLLRLPSLFEPFWYGDENIYLAVGQGIRKGLVLYSDITDFPNKPPLIYFFAALVRGVSGFRLLLLFWNMINVGFFFALAKKLIRHKLTSFFATLAFIFLTSTPLIEGNIANAEIFFIMPTTVALWLLFRDSDKPAPAKTRLLPFFLAGTLLGFSFLFKIHVILDIAAIFLFFFVFNRLKKITLKSLIKLIFHSPLWLFIAGLATPVVVILTALATQGVSPLALFSNAASSQSYTSVWGPTNFVSQFVGFGSLLARTVLLTAITAILFIFRRKLNPRFLFVSLWLFFTLFAALLSARNYPHYLIQPVLPLVLGLALLTRLKTNRLGRIALFTPLIFVAAAFFRFNFGFWQVIPYYQNFISYATGNINRIEYYRRFDGRMPRNYELANYLRQVSSPQDKIYIWGTEPGVYTMADRLPVEKLVVSFHVADLNYYDPTIKALQQNLPKIIVFMESEPRTFPQLEALLATKYMLIQKIGDPTKNDLQNTGSRALVYRRINNSPSF